MNLRMLILVMALLVAGDFVLPCSAAEKPATASAATKPAAAATSPAAGRSAAIAAKPWTGDLDKMVERRVIRVLVPYSKTFYFIDGGQQRGISYELMHAFEDSVNTKRKITKLSVNVVFIPVARDQLMPRLLAGTGDVVAADLTITPQRSANADFTVPLASDVNEVVVRASDAPKLATLDELSGKEVFLQQTSSYYEHVQALNVDLKKRGKAEIAIRAAPETFEAEDILEMVNAGLVKYTIVDRYLANFWQKIFPRMQIDDTLMVHDHGDIAFAIRKNSPLLKAELDAFLNSNKRGTTFGNVLVQRYLKDTRWAKSATTAAEMKKFTQLRDLFHKYGDQYKLDWLLMAAQGYQESRLDQGVHSKVGAVGVMQVMPATGKQMGTGDVHQIEPNIHAGVKYIRYMIDQYYKDEPMDDLNKALFAFASYNAGPNRIRSLRDVAAKRGLDPNKWFNNVEYVASEKIGRETVQYVSNIYKYYVAYSLAAEQMRLDEEHKKQKTGLAAAG
jgi:membrane-bound lytic murein transglycosylase MltF